MLLDRACPSGGWNAGNAVVYGVPLPPHPDDTAIALLALSAQKDHSLVQLGVRSLELTASGLQAPSSLAWAVLALAAHGRPAGRFALRLRGLSGLARIEDTSTLAAVCLALDEKAALQRLGVIS